MKTWKQSAFFGILAILVFTIALVACNNDDNGNGNNNNGNDPTWVDPATQTTPLTGGTELLGYSSGHKALPGSQYQYETWEPSEGKESNNSKFIWYGSNQGGGGAFRAEWAWTYLHARLGFLWGDGGKYDQYNNIYVDYNFKRSDNASTSNGGYIGVYGWFKSPSALIDDEKVIEYYIVDDWFYDEQLGSGHINGTEIGSFTIDGSVYKIYKSLRVNEPSIAGPTRITFTQIFSVRQNRRTYGTISVTEHFNEWAKYFKLDNIFEVDFFVEVFGGNGYLDLTYLYLSQENKRKNMP